MGINDEANNLDSALKRGSNSARQLSFAIATSNNNLGLAVHAASQLAEELARASKVAKLAEMATGIGLIVAAIGTVVSATILWKDKQTEIANQVKEISSATAALNAQASNLPKLARERLAEEIRVTAEKDKQLAAIKKEQDFLGGLGKKLHDYSAQIAAVNANADAQMRAFDAEASRRQALIQARLQTTLTNERVAQGLQADIELAQSGFGIFSETKFRTPVAFKSPEQQAREILRLQELQATQTAAAQLRGTPGEEGGLSDDQIETVLMQIRRQFSAKAEVLEQSFIRPLGDQLGRSFADSIAEGISAGIQNGSIEKGFRALLGGLLIGLGRMMVEIGTQSLLFARLLDGVVSALRSFAPAGAIGPALALIAGGAVLEGIGAALGGGGGGGGSRGGGGFGGGSSSGTTIIDRGLINPANGFVTSPGIITPNSGAAPVVFLIGKDDPRAQRDLLEMIDRGRVRRGDK